ncbi:PQQ-dependent sugar dehydrogenase [Roseibium sp. DSM 29163]|uniref:PQQ-dependent sugar dehydrogenase n=1 Tax=Roseibium salinum TaxID=1604349 RepID=A0ABT3R3I8_9HYPH|nr:PQQ-dependent sugar dehydrogenase [Roseibium sp. DSM 29163]MCX2723768.1 PQQ-dependent sugar dehydrogenase [Roseibium sp. DSM 29163]
MTFKTLFVSLFAASVSAFGFSGTAAGQSSIDLETVASDLSYPWSVAFLPDGGYLVTERDGALKHVSQDGEQSVVEGTPDVFAQGQGGLLDVVLSPDFENDRTVYLTFSQGSPEGAGTSLFKATLAEGDGGLRLENGETIFAANNKSYGGRHFGSRLAFAPDGTLFMTVGERGRASVRRTPRTTPVRSCT